MGMNIMRMKGRAKMMRTIKVTGKGKIAVKPDKEKDQIAWVRAANQHRVIVEEIILKELIYV